MFWIKLLWKLIHLSCTRLCNFFYDYETLFFKFNLIDIFIILYFIYCIILYFHDTIKYVEFFHTQKKQSNLIKFELAAFDILGKYYLSWALDIEIHLDTNSFGDAIKEGNKTSSQEKAQVMIFLCHHLHESLSISW